VALSPTASAILTAVLVPLVAWRIYVRFRRASGRQRLSRYRAPVTLTIYGLLTGAIALANLQHPLSLLALTLATLAGGSLAAFALTRTRFDPTPKGLFYTPHGPVGIALALLFVARIAYRLIEVYLLDPMAAHSAAEFGRSPLTLGAFGMLAGFYLWYTLGLARWRCRVLRAKREREAARDNP
jgi:hypothetical protein